MNKLEVITFIVISICITLLTSCVDGDRYIKIAPSKTIQPNQETVQSSGIETQISRKTITPSEIPNLPILTPTLSPTRTSQEAQTIMKQYIQTNGGCSLPCIWNFTPGQSTPDHLVGYFSWLGWEGKTYDMPKGPVYYTGIDGDRDQGRIDFAAYVYENTVEAISLGVVINDLANLDQIYYTKQALKDMGKPDEIWVSLAISGEIALPDHTGFNIFITNNDPPIIIEYSGIAKLEGEAYHFCLRQINLDSEQGDNGLENITVYSGNSTLFKTPKQLVEPFGLFGGTLISTKALGKTPSDIYEELITQDNIPCFETKINAWR